MNRRQRHERIIENFGSFTHDNHVRFHFIAVTTRMGLAALSDAGAEAFAKALVDSRRRQAVMNKQNRIARNSTVPK